MKRIFTLLAALIIILNAAASSQVEVLLQQGDSLYTLFDNEGARAAYSQAMAYEPQNPEILWKLSRANVDIGEHLEGDESEQHFNRALAFADSAIAADSASAEAHLRRAIALGKIALFKGVFKSVSLVKKVRASLERALELDPDNPTAHYVMGRTHHKLCEKPKIARKLLGLGWANREIGLQEYRRAIELDSAFIMYRIDYARLLLEMKMREEGKIQLELIADLPIRDEDDERFKQDALELLEEHRL